MSAHDALGGEELWLIRADQARDDLYMTGDTAAFRAVTRRLGFCEFEIEEDIAAMEDEG
jgi:hypothetical protein